MFNAPTFIPFTMIWITHGIGGWGISFVLPTVIYELGISDTGIAQVMIMVREAHNSGGETYLTVLAPIHACLHHPMRSRPVHPYEASVALGCWLECRADTDRMLHPLDHQQAACSQIHLCHDCNCGIAIVLPHHLA